MFHYSQSELTLRDHSVCLSTSRDYTHHIWVETLYISISKTLKLIEMEVCSITLKVSWTADPIQYIWVRPVYLSTYVPSPSKNLEPSTNRTNTTSSKVRSTDLFCYWYHSITWNCKRDHGRSKTHLRCIIELVLITPHPPSPKVLLGLVEGVSTTPNPD